jgi:Response regulator containing CheY-like receiver domain and AraC-type DNA-binding domain
MSFEKSKSCLMDQKYFWDSLQFDFATSGHNPTYEDFRTLLERSFIFNLFFKGYTPKDMSYYQKLFGIKNYGYVILIDLYPKGNHSVSDVISDEYELFNTTKDSLQDTCNIVGPLIANKIGILICLDTMIPDQVHKEKSTVLCQKIIHKLETNYKLQAKASIGSVQGINSFYTSYIQTLTCQTHNKSEKIFHYLNKKTLKIDSNNIDYLNTEQHLFEAVRGHSRDAYNYFGILMDWLRFYDDETKRNKIFELLTLITFAQNYNNPNEFRIVDYTTYIREFMSYNGDEIIQNATQRFLIITNYFQSQSTIDYSNHIVKTTKEYLEKNYAEDISLEDIAAQANISPQYFSKLIKKTTGFNFIDWLSMLRVKRAKELLINSELSVKEVCFMVGYKDPNYFSRIFKKRNGMTPSEFVKSQMSNNKN